MMTTVSDKHAAFRQEAQVWLDENFPKTLSGRGAELLGNGEGGTPLTGEALTWCQRLGSKGWGTPTWPAEYGGADLDQSHARVLQEEMGRVGAFNPIPLLAGMGVTMVGPTILEYGTDDQKAQHLPPISRGEIRWCLGYSEPNAGSDLASLSTKAEDDGDAWRVNGQKVWTSGADISQWCGALVRTDPKAKKHSGISFLMLKMDQPGIETRPIKLISGFSPFCETFFNDARAEKSDMLGHLNDGWSVGKRLLQHERVSQTGARGTPGPKSEPLQALAKRYIGSDANGQLADPDLRIRLANHLMAAKAHGLTIDRITAEARGNVTVSASASILKNSATNVAQTQAELSLEIMGHNGLGWEGEGFGDHELQTVRTWLFGKAMSIYGGSAEVQNNIISKNILGLPETTQKG
jgi:alkylation response protein AidB-like acyl-CoA dehydrogenase